MQIKIIDPNLNLRLFDKIKNRIKRYLISIFSYFKNNFLIYYINTKSKNLIDSHDSNYNNDLKTLNDIKFTNLKNKKINIFLFFVDVNNSSYLEKRKNFSKNIYDEYKILYNFCNHIKNKYSDHQIILFTDFSSVIKKNINAHIVRFNFNSKYPMYNRNRLMKIYVNSNKFDQNTIFLDFDTILNLDTKKIFNNDFDIGLTFRKNDKLMPINEGVIFANAQNKERVIIYFNKLNDIYRYLSKDKIINMIFDNILIWRGGQLSLSAFLQWKKLYLGHNYINKINFLILDSHYYNFTPIKSISHEELISKKILHLKGWVKGYQDKILDHL
tara:strand:+ start:3415 stop:4398 length:984 start_codon:yes stop_codon:yes gene_type:complete